MNNKIQVRRYQDGDAKFLSRIYYNTIHTVDARDYTKEQIDAWAPWSSVQDYSGWQEKLEKIKPFVALINDKIVGFAEFEPNGHIDCFYVHHEFQGSGVGSALIHEIEKEAVDKSISRVYAEVSITAKPFFEAKGFHVVKQQAATIRGVELINFVMEKRYQNLRFLLADDIPILVEAFNAIGWSKPSSLFEQYLKESEAAERLIWVVFIHDRFAGYITLKSQSQYESFARDHIP